MEHEKNFSVNEVAENLDGTVQEVTQYLRTGRLVGFKVGGHWRVLNYSFKEFLLKSNNKIIGGNVNE